MTLPQATPSERPPDPFPAEAHLTSNLNLVELPTGEIRRALAAVVTHDKWDAVIVPCVRGPEALVDVFRIAGRLGVPLILLCSQFMKAAHVSAWAAGAGRAVVGDVGWIAFDVAPVVPRDWSMLPFGLPAATDPDENDVSVKRNAGLALARLMNWDNILFMDDDIADDHLEPNLDLALRLLVGADRDHRPRDAVGFTFRHHQRDDSAVGHACHHVGSRHEPFLGAGVLGLRASNDLPAFPPSYNEDWLFLSVLIARDRASVALVGDARQLTDDVLPEPEEAKAQERGELLAEGLFEFLQSGAGAEEFDVKPRRRRFWENAFFTRVQILEIAGRRLKETAGSPAQTTFRQVIKAIEELHGAGAFGPDELAEFYRAWRDGEAAWSAYLDELATARSRGEMLRRLLGLGLSPLGADAGSTSLYHLAGLPVPHTSAGVAAPMPGLQQV